MSECESTNLLNAFGWQGGTKTIATPKKGIRGRKDHFIQIVYAQVETGCDPKREDIKIINAITKKDISYKFDIKFS